MATYFQADETRWRVFVDKAKKTGQRWWLLLFAGEDNNYGEGLIRKPAAGRKNYYGSGAEWSGRMAMMLFSLFATLALWKINPRNWLTCYFAACALVQPMVEKFRTIRHPSCPGT